MRSGYHFQEPLPKTVKDAVQDKKIANVQKSVRAINRKQELKFFDVFANTTAGTAFTFASLCTPTQGDTELQREGNEIHPTSIQWRGRLTVAAAATFSPIVRMIIAWDQQPNGAVPATADLVDAATITPLISSPYNHDSNKRFKILYDRRYVIEGQPALTSLNSKLIQGKIKLSRVMKFNDVNGGTVADIITNNLFIAFVSNDNTNQPLFIVGFRTYYKD